MKTFKLLAITSLFAVMLAGCDWFSGGQSSGDPSSGSASTPSSSVAPQPTSYGPIIPESIETHDKFVVDGVDLGDYYHNIWYTNAEGKIINTYKEGAKNYDGEFNVNKGRDYYKSDDPDYSTIMTRCNYDLIIPKDIDKSVNNKVVLVLHGGAWVGGEKSEVDHYLNLYVKKGLIVANMDYTRIMPDFGTMSLGFNKDLSVFRMLDEIDACITHLKARLVSEGFDGSKLKLIFSGVSAGSHIAMLYAYSRAADSALPISFILDAVGPVDIQTSSWKQFINPTDAVLNAGIGPEALAAQVAAGNVKQVTTSFNQFGFSASITWDDYNTMLNAASMCGAPFTSGQLMATSTDQVHIDMENPVAQKMVNHFEKLVSVTHHVKTGGVPILMAYGGKDSIVGIGQYAALKAKLDACSIENEFFYFRNSDHSLSEDGEQFTALIAKLTEWLASK